MTPDIPLQLPLDPPAPDAETFGSVPAASAIAECLRVQSDVAPRSTIARVFGRSPLSDDSRPWYLGALGELEVAKRLESLGPGWTVLHAVPVGTRGSDIDHVVIGAAGVFTINTKFHEDARVWVGSRRLLVNGQRKDHLRNARFEADRVRKMMAASMDAEVPVASVVAIAGAKEITIRESPEGVTVLRAAALARWLSRQPNRLDAPTVERLAATLSRRETWTSDAGEPADIPAFADLQREVGGAKRVRMLWGAAVLVAIIGIAVPVAMNFYARLLGG